VPYTIPSVSDFKTQFPRDFPYAVPAWGAIAGTAVLAAGVIQSAPINAGGQGYQTTPIVIIRDASGTGATATAVVAQGRVTGLAITAGGTGYSAPTFEFIGGAGDDTDMDKVVDADIEGGITDALFNGSQSLFDSQTSYARAFLYLTAHCIIVRIRMAGQGLASQATWLIASKGAGDVTSSFQIPDRIMRDPMLAAFSSTDYGKMYLQIISPLLVGNIGTAHRRTLP